MSVCEDDADISRGAGVDPSAVAGVEPGLIGVSELVFEMVDVIAAVV